MRVFYHSIIYGRNNKWSFPIYRKFIFKKLYPLNIQLNLNWRRTNPKRSDFIIEGVYCIVLVCIYTDRVFKKISHGFLVWLSLSTSSMSTTDASIYGEWPESATHTQHKRRKYKTGPVHHFSCINRACMYTAQQCTIYLWVAGARVVTGNMYGWNVLGAAVAKVVK